MEKKNPLPKNDNLIQRKMKIMKKKILCCNTEQLSEQKRSIQWIQKGRLENKFLRKNEIHNVR